MRIISWNVNGIRAVAKKGFANFLLTESPDVICLQETKAHREQLESSLVNINGYESYFVSGESRGTGGVAVYTKQRPVEIESGCGDTRFDFHGRVMSVDFGEFVLFNVYSPWGQEGVEFKLEFFNRLLVQWEVQRSKGRNVIVCGDFNIAHKEIDYANASKFPKRFGFLREERAWLDELTRINYVDPFRTFSPARDQYTWWPYSYNSRAKNIGMRLDYFFVNREFATRVKGAKIMSEVMGSDHCPIELVME